MAAQGVPFDGAAAGYDATFTDLDLGRRLRAIVWRDLDRVFGPGDRVLELGCGTGADAVHLAGRGVTVLATDVSEAMLLATRERVRATATDDLVTVARLDLDHPEAIGDLVPAGAPLFDGAFSDFGALDCVADRVAVWRRLADVIRPGGWLVVVLMPPVCAWEIGWHLLHGEWHRAGARFRSGSAASLPGGGSIRVWYPSPGRVRGELAPWFRTRSVRGVGVALPASGLSAAMEPRPDLLRVLDGVERQLARLPIMAGVADHYALVAQRV